MGEWSRPPRPAAYAESALIAAIVRGTYAPGTTLPAERQLAALLGVTRPTLREVLQRLERDGWLAIRQGKPTIVNDYWRDGSVNILSSLVSHGGAMPASLIAQLLEVRSTLAPGYVRAAIERSAPEVVRLLGAASDLPDTPEAYAAHDWALHRGLALASGNPVYALILNSLAAPFQGVLRHHYRAPAARQAAHTFWQALLAAAVAADPDAAEEVTHSAMNRAYVTWRRPDRGATAAPKARFPARMASLVAQVRQGLARVLGRRA